MSWLLFQKQRTVVFKKENNITDALHAWLSIGSLKMFQKYRPREDEKKPKSYVQKKGKKFNLLIYIILQRLIQPWFKSDCQISI